MRYELRGKRVWSACDAFLSLEMSVRAMWMGRRIQELEGCQGLQ